MNDEIGSRTPYPTTKEQAEDEIKQQFEVMMDWVEGRATNWNLFANSGASQRIEELAQCAVADAQEVVKRSAAIQALVSIIGTLPRTTMTIIDTMGDKL